MGFVLGFFAVIGSVVFTACHFAKKGVVLAVKGVSSIVNTVKSATESNTAVDRATNEEIYEKIRKERQSTREPVNINVEKPKLSSQIHQQPSVAETSVTEGAPEAPESPEISGVKKFHLD